MATIPFETSEPWAPNMIFRARRDRRAPQTLCEEFVEEHVVTFFRTYLPQGGPNYNYGPMMERATRFVTYIIRLRADSGFQSACVAVAQGRSSSAILPATVNGDAELKALIINLADQGASDPFTLRRAGKINFYQQNGGLVDQLVWGITHPADAHPSIRQDLDGDAFLVAVLLIMHFLLHGGLVLPPLQAARIRQTQHEEFVAREKREGRWVDGGINSALMHYPSWRGSRATAHS